MPDIFKEEGARIAPQGRNLSKRCSSYKEKHEQGSHWPVLKLQEQLVRELVRYDHKSPLNMHAELILNVRCRAMNLWSAHTKCIWCQFWDWNMVACLCKVTMKCSRSSQTEYPTTLRCPTWRCYAQQTHRGPNTATSSPEWCYFMLDRVEMS